MKRIWGRASKGTYEFGEINDGCFKGPSQRANPFHAGNR